MKTAKKKPGPNAQVAFRLGVVAASVLMLAVIAYLYSVGALAAAHAGYVLVVLFPVYLVFVAVVLSVWLGYNKDASDLRPVYRRREQS